MEGGKRACQALTPLGVRASQYLGLFVRVGVRAYLRRGILESEYIAKQLGNEARVDMSRIHRPGVNPQPRVRFSRIN